MSDILTATYHDASHCDYSYTTQNTRFRMKTADPVLLLHFTDFEDADQFKQKRTQCNYCTTTLARKNVSIVVRSASLPREELLCP